MNVIDKLNEILPQVVTSPLDYLDTHQKEFNAIFGITFNNFILSDLSLYKTLKAKKAKDIPDIGLIDLSQNIAYILALVVAIKSTANDETLDRTYDTYDRYDGCTTLDYLFMCFYATSRITHMEYSVWELDEDYSNDYFYNYFDELVEFGKAYMAERSKQN